MRGVNKVIIVGNLGADPESRQFSNGGSVTNISVATSEQWTDKQTGERREATEWHRISLFNRLGEVAAQYLRKGSQVYIEGSLRTRKWQDQNGQDRYTTEIRADNMQMLGGAGGGGYQGNQGNQNYNNQNNQVGYDDGYNNYNNARKIKTVLRTIRQTMLPTTVNRKTPIKVLTIKPLVMLRPTRQLMMIFRSEEYVI